LLFLMAALPARSAFSEGATFTRITEGDLVTIAGNYSSESWADYDDDGDLDVLVGSEVSSTRNYLYRNDGQAGFTLVDAAMPRSPSNQHSSAWGNYDNDGFIDLVIGGHEPRNRLFHNNGDGSFTKITNHALVNDPADT
jgi:hypothetical protein